MNKKIFSSALFIGIFFCMAFCVGLNFANAGSVAQAGACTLKSSDCATGLYCYNGALRNYCTPQITDQTICASGSFVADSELDNCRYGCSNGKYYSAYANTTAVFYEYRCGTSTATAAQNATNNATATAGSCETGETCMDVNGDYSPAGYECTLRGVCPGAQACCKKDADTSATPTIKTGAAATSGAAANASGASNAAASGTGTSGGTSSGTAFINPLQFKTVEALLSNVLLSVQMIIGTLALVFIVIGAIMILSSAGTPEMVERGKKAIYMAFVGLAIGVAAPSLLKELARAIGWGGTSQTAAALSLSQIALNVLNFLLGVAGVLTLIMLVIGGIMYLTSAGDEDRIDSGKKIFKNSLIGILIIFAAMILVQQIAKFFVAG